jgi:two-component system NarL family sensor kinase
MQEILAELDAWFRLSWTFTGIIALLTALLLALYAKTRRAEKRGRQNAETSLAIIQGQEEERRRVAGELHDLILPELRLLAGSAPAAAKVRELCARLLPPDFERVSFKDTLIALCASFSRRAVMDFKTAVDDTLDLGLLGGESRLALYRIVQEALANAEKHARGPVVLVARNSAWAGERTLLICVSDHGPGLGKNLERRSGDAPLGMRIMRLRAASLGASLDFKSEEGNGLMVRLETPLASKPPQP